MRNMSTPVDLSISSYLPPKQGSQVKQEASPLVNLHSGLNGELCLEKPIYLKIEASSHLLDKSRQSFTASGVASRSIKRL